MLTVNILTADDRFLPLLQVHLTRTLARYGELQHILRFLDTQEKWLLAFMVYRQWIASQECHASGRVYASAILDEAARICRYSRNTVSAFIDGLAAYGIICKTTDTRDRRFQEISMTDKIHDAFLFWYLNHGLTLDMLDGGDRAARLNADPTLLRRIHPPLVTCLIDEEGWRHPSLEIDTFFQIKNGYLVLDYLMTELTLEPGSPPAYSAGIISRSALGSTFAVGRSTIYRLFDLLEKRGFAYWVATSDGSELWFYRSFIQAVCRWQAEKFVRIDKAYRAT